jgi:hypothetical protein
VCFFIFHIGGPGGKVYSTLELKSLAEVGLGSLLCDKLDVWSFQHTTFGRCLFFFLNLFEALFKARLFLFFSGQQKRRFEWLCF